EEPTRAAYVPACTPLVVTAAVPADVQPDRLPTSKSPLAIAGAAAARVAGPTTPRAATTTVAARVAFFLGLRRTPIPSLPRDVGGVRGELYHGGGGGVLAPGVYLK